MKKKVFSILLAVAMLASLTVGCGGKEEPADVPETTEEIVETKVLNIRLSDNFF